jgi:hypothetical protein
MKDVKDMIKDEMEKYRDEDRKEEAAQVPLTESQKKQEELEPIEKGACIIGEARKDREEPQWPPDGISFKEKYEKEHKLRQEAEGELTILKGIETNRVKEAQARSNQLQDELDRFKKENNHLYNRLSDALEVDESHQKLNGKFQERLTELEEENKKMREHLNKQIENARKSGM